MEQDVRLVVTMSILALTLGCASAGRLVESRGTGTCAEQEVFPVGTGLAVIFPAGNGHVEGYGPGTIKEFWTPAREDVLSAEPRIDAYLEANAPELASKLARYTRQYSGFYLDDRKFIFVQFFCGLPSELTWRCAPVVVDDGGDCYFHLEYDLDKGMCRNLWINGSA